MWMGGLSKELFFGTYRWKHLLIDFLHFRLMFLDIIHISFGWIVFRKLSSSAGGGMGGARGLPPLLCPFDGLVLDLDARAIATLSSALVVGSRRRRRRRRRRRCSRWGSYRDELMHRWREQRGGRSSHCDPGNILLLDHCLWC